MQTHIHTAYACTWYTHILASLCMYMYRCMHTYIHTYIQCVCAHANVLCVQNKNRCGYMDTRMDVCVYRMCMYISMHIVVCACVCVCVCVCLCVCKCTVRTKQKQMWIYGYMDGCVCVYRMCVYISMHIVVCACVCVCLWYANVLCAQNKNRCGYMDTWMDVCVYIGCVCKYPCT